MKYIVVLCTFACTVAFAEPERLSNGKLVPTESTAYNNANIQLKKNGRGKVESKKKKKTGKNKKPTNK